MRHNLQGQRSRSQGRLMLRPEVRCIFRTERPTNLKLAVPKITQNSYCTLLWRARGARAFNGGLGAEPPAVVWGQSPQRGPGTEPLVRGSGGEAP